jgi:acetylornithine deacetylase/succinyl-diaminopimelate desuccinylase-like protein
MILFSGRRGWLAATLLLFLAAPAAAEKLPSDAVPTEHMEQYSDLAVRWMQEYLQVDTSNPPGNEARAAAFFKRILDREGIESQVFEYAPGRANLIARLKGNGKRRPIILLNHTDVVTSDPARWKAPPFSGRIVDGVMYGRGAQDMKCEGLAQLMVMVMLKREKIPLDRDVIFLATADEEVDSTGTDWMIAHQRSLFGDAEFLITEGGENLRDPEGVKYIGVDVAEKSPFWLVVTAHGRPGHGSRPIPDSAPNRLVRALSRILAHQAELKALPVTEEFLRQMAPSQTGQRARWFRDLKSALRDKRFRKAVENDESLDSMLRNTISLTMLRGSQQTNVIPGEAVAHLDARLLPGEDPKAFLEEMRSVVDDPNVSVEPENAEFRVANASPLDTALFGSFRRVAAHYFPGAPVVPRLTSGYTENQRYRELGIASYGFSPYTVTSEEGATEHADNERIRVEELRRGYRVLYDVVTGVAGAPAP